MRENRRPFDTIEGFRHQVMATDTPGRCRSIKYLQVGHPGPAHGKDGIPCGLGPRHHGWYRTRT